MSVCSKVKMATWLDSENPTASSMTDSIDIELNTSKFKISKGEMLAKVLFQRYGAVLWSALAAVMAIGSASALLLDWRCALVAVMMVFILLPAIIAFVFYNYALSLRVLCECYEHTLSISSGGIQRVSYLPCPDGDEQSKSKEVKEYFTWGEISKYTLSLQGMTLWLHSSPPGFITIPWSILPQPKEDGEKLINFLEALCGKKVRGRL